jgi:hypothetical protein
VNVLIWIHRTKTASFGGRPEAPKLLRNRGLTGFAYRVNPFCMSHAKPAVPKPGTARPSREKRFLVRLIRSRRCNLRGRDVEEVRMAEKDVAMIDSRAGEPLPGLDKLPEGVLEAVEQAEIRTRFDIRPGTILTEAVLRANEIVFHEGGDLTFATPQSPHAVLWGDRVHFHNGAVQSAVRVTAPPPVNGSVGTPGSPGSRGGSWGKDGGKGGPGGGGSPGLPGAPVPSLIFRAGEVSFDREPTPGASPLAIEARGVDGGIGGPGGPGGTGGKGHRGRPGRDEFEPRDPPNR